MGCSIDEIVIRGDSVTVWAEGQCITYILVNGKVKYTAFSSKYFECFNFRPLCKLEHEEAALKAFSEINQKTSTVKKRKQRKKKGAKISKYAIDEANLVSDKLRDRQFWDAGRFPVNENGEYVCVSFEEIVKTIREKTREQYKAAADKGEKADHQRFTATALDEIGCFDRWSRGRIQSELSKRMHARRKARKKKVKNQILNDARKVERDHHQLPLEVN